MVKLRSSLQCWLGKALLLVLGKTLRVTAGGEVDMARQGNSIYAVWHGRMLLVILSLRGRGVSALISQHRDGDYLSGIVSTLGFNPVRGSTTKGGTSALRQLVGHGLRGRDLAVTPDGPRGPSQKAKMGVVKLAQLTQMPIVPISFGASRALTLRSWDGFLLPLPFSRCSLLLGAPIRVPSEAPLEEARTTVERALMKLTERADSIFRCRGAPVESASRRVAGKVLEGAGLRLADNGALRP